MLCFCFYFFHQDQRVSLKSLATSMIILKPLYCGFALGGVTNEGTKAIEEMKCWLMQPVPWPVWKLLSSSKCDLRHNIMNIFIWTLPLWLGTPVWFPGSHCVPEPFTLNWIILRKLKQNWLFSYTAGRWATKEIVLYAPKTKMTFGLSAI